MTASMTASTCPLCGGTETARFAIRMERDRPWHVAQCRGCSLVFTDPQPTAADILTFYEGDYHAELRKPGGAETAFGLKFDDYCRWLRRYVPPGKSLDIGCATGLLVKKLADAGFQAEGYELNPLSAEWGRKHYGVEIHSGLFDPHAAPPASYDLITLCDVLEHTRHPLQYLSSLRPLLRQQGHVMVAFPDVWSLEGRYYRVMSKLFDREWLWRTCNVPGHTWEFTPRTARRVFESAGFDVVAFRRRQDPGGGWTWQGPVSLIDLPPRILSWPPIGNLFGTQMHFILQPHHR
jgi:2-polyprenyl-3-methyl-5-hydroxy-6-metoxy-1,4-benzoquinol methylase